MELLNSLFHFFADKKKLLSHKLVLGILSVVALVIIDNTFSFSYYYNTHNKIQEIDNINKILNSSSLESKERKELLSLRENIIARKTWKDKAWDFVSNMEFTNDKAEYTVAEFKRYPKELKEKYKIKERSYLWHFISSSWIFLITMFIIPFIAFWDYRGDFGITLGLLLLLETLSYGMAWTFAKLMSYIPVIASNPVYNYVLNGVLCFLAFLVFNLLFSERKTTSKVE